MPDLGEGLGFEVAQLVLGVFVEAAGCHQSVPGNDRILPESPASVCDASFVLGTGCCFQVAAVAVDGGDQVVWVVCIIVDLGGFEPDRVDAEGGSQFFHLVDLVFVGLNDEELKDDEGCFALEFLFPAYDVSGSFQYFFQFTAHSVLLVDVLRGTIDGYDEAVESALDRAFGVLIGQVVGVGGGGGVDVFIGGEPNHIQKIRVEGGFSLKIEDQVGKVFV